MDNVDATRRGVRNLVSDVTGSIRRTIVNDQDAYTWQLEQALDDRTHVLRFVVGGQDHNCVKPGIHARTHEGATSVPEGARVKGIDISNSVVSRALRTKEFSGERLKLWRQKTGRPPTLLYARGRQKQPERALLSAESFLPPVVLISPRLHF
jgi:hypothetical protein